MLKFITQKIKNKLWLTVCLLLGLTFLVASFSCQPMFKDGSMNKLLNQTFTGYIEDENKYPTVIGRQGAYKTGNVPDVSGVQNAIAEYERVWEKYLAGIDVLNRQTVLRLSEQASRSAYGSRAIYLRISHIPDMLSHALILKGTDYNGNADEGYYPCMISESVMDRYRLVVGETIDFTDWKDDSGETLKLIVAGIFKESDNTDLFWYTGPNDFGEEIFVGEEAFNDIVSRYHADTIYYEHVSLLDYTDFDNGNADDIIYYVEQFAELDSSFVCTFNEMLAGFVGERKSVDIMLWVLELPIFGMVLAFIYMVSGQIIETERNEIAMLKSRGMSRLHVILIYFAQSGILAVGGILLGVPMGFGLCKLSAQTTDFLTFKGTDSDLYRFVPVMLLYGLAASVIGIIFILIPVVRYSVVSIVEHKSNYDQGKKMFWEKYFLDVLLLGLSLYLLYNFNQSMDSLRTKALQGSKMDPMIFLDTILFILAFGLLTLRLIHYLVKLVYEIGKKRWKPAAYVSFLQITRTFGRQGFISVFMILTVSMGLFNANAARTINKNHEDRIVYELGSDVVLKEKWESKAYQDSDYKIRYTYIEPDYIKYGALVQDGFCDSVSRVLRYGKTQAVAHGKTALDCMVMGIHTKEFGETAFLKEELYGDTHWYNWLNDLGQKRGGIIISRNLAEELELEEGDALTFNGIQDNEIDNDHKMRGVVCGIVDAWPGYEQYYYEDGVQRERSLIVANYAEMTKYFEAVPYEIWCDLSEGVSADDLYGKLNADGIEIESYRSVDDDVYEMKNSPEIQITNGMFTLGFIIALVLCGIGFMIYWISSIRQRELLFGVYRAMGMSVSNVNHMLINEHIFSTLLSVVAGGLVGMAATFLYIRLFGIVYMPEKHNLDIYIYYESGDIIKLFAVIAVMIVVCLLMLRKLIRSMNITQALKLGEE